MDESSFNKVSLFTTAMMRVDLNLMSNHFKKKTLALLCDVLTILTSASEARPISLFLPLHI